MKKWEYESFSKNINIDGSEEKNIKKFLNELGNRGWEVIRDNAQAHKDKTMITIVFLCKREKSMIIQAK